MPKATSGSGSSEEPKKHPSQKSPTGAGDERSSAAGGDGVQRRVAEKRQEVERFLSKDDFDSALPLLKKLAALTHESTQDTTSWARRQIQIVTRRAAQSQEQTAAVCRLARQLLEQRDYTGAVKVLSDVSEIEATDESRDLLEEAREIVSELSVLGGEIEAAMDSKRYEDARPLVARYLKLKPKDKKVREISERLNSYGGRGAMTAGFSKDRSYGKGESFGIRGALLITAAVAVVAFGVGYALIFSQLTGEQTIAVSIDTAVPASDLEFDVAGKRYAAQSLGAGLKLKSGQYTVRLLRGATELAVTELVVEAKSQNPLLRVEMRNGATSLIVVSAAPIPTPATVQAESSQPATNSDATANPAMNPSKAPATTPATPPQRANSAEAIAFDMAETEHLKKLLAKRGTGVMMAFQVQVENQVLQRMARTAAEVPNEPIRVTQATFQRSDESPFDQSDVDMLKSFPNLQIISLGGGGWSGDELGALTGNSKLESITVIGDTAYPVDALPPCRAFAHLPKFVNLRALYLINLAVSDANLESLRAFQKLENLHVTADDLSSRGIQSLKELSNLRSLSLLCYRRGSTGFKDQDIGILGGLTKLENLTLIPAQDLSGAGFASLPQLPALKYLNIGTAPRLGDEGVAAIARLAPNLEALFLNFGQRLLPELPFSPSSITPRSLAAIRDLSKLKVLRIHGATAFEGADLKELSNLPELQTLDLARSGDLSKGMKSIAACQKLVTLMLSLNRIGDTACGEIAAMQNLTSVTLEYTDITDNGLTRLATHKTLRQVSVTGTKVTSGGVDQLKKARPELQVSGP